jgi:hypothetical protein
MLLTCAIDGLTVYVTKLGDDLSYSYQGVRNFYEDTHLTAQS